MGTQFPITIVSTKHIVNVNIFRRGPWQLLSAAVLWLTNHSSVIDSRHRAAWGQPSDDVVQLILHLQLLTATSKGAISILTTYRISSPQDRQPTPHHHWQASLTCLFDRPPKSAADKYIRNNTQHCVTVCCSLSLCALSLCALSLSVLSLSVLSLSVLSLSVLSLSVLSLSPLFLTPPPPCTLAWQQEAR